MITPFKHLIGVLLLTGTVFISYPAFAQRSPVIGYVIGSYHGKQNGFLTVNGHKWFRLMTGHGQMDLEERLIAISKKCNELIATGDFDPSTLNLSLRGEDYVLKMGAEPIFTLDRKSALGYRQPALLTMLHVTNRLRVQLGTDPLTEVPAHLFDAKPTQVGYASWYGGRFIGRHTASGVRYNPRHLTAAHPALPFGTHILVTSLDTKKSVIVTVNDRGPFHGHRIIDLSAAAFKKIGMLNSGVLKVRLDVLR